MLAFTAVRRGISSNHHNQKKSPTTLQVQQPIRITTSSQLKFNQPFLRYYSAEHLDQSEVSKRVLNVVKNFHKIDNSIEVKPESNFINDLGLDSLDTVEVVMKFEDEFCIEIPDNEAEKIQTCSDAIKYVLSHPHAK